LAYLFFSVRLKHCTR